MYRNQHKLGPSHRQNEVERLTQGWFSVKNRSTQENADGVTIEERHKREKKSFAACAPWTDLKKERTGIYAVRLYDHICSEFPEVVKDIEKLATSTQKKFGATWPFASDYRRSKVFLDTAWNAYQQDVSNALGGNYDPELDKSIIFWPHAEIPVLAVSNSLTMEHELPTGDLRLVHRKRL